MLSTRRIVLGLVLCWLLAAPAVRGDDTYGLAQRRAYLAQAEQTLRAAAEKSVSPELWPWLDQHPELKTGLLAAMDPPSAIEAANLDLLRQSLPPALADKYAGLLLAVALKNDPLDADVPSLAPPSAEVVKVGEWIKATGGSMVAVMADPAAAKAGVPDAAGKQKDFWERVAYQTGTYPPRVRQTVPQFIALLVSRLETPAPAATGAENRWPPFPTAAAPYPLLTWLRATDPVRECDWTWAYYWGKLPDQKKAGLIGYGNYSWDYQQPQIMFRVSDWNPESPPRIWQDGGVCGRLSTMAERFRVELGKPAAGVGQPGHRAFIMYNYDRKNSRWTCDMGQAITGIDHTTLLSPGLPPINHFMNRAGVNALALASAMNLGLGHYQDGLIAAHLALRQTDPQPRRDLLLASVRSNPYQVQIWKELADLAGNDSRACAAMLQGMDAALESPTDAGEEVGQARKWIAQQIGSALAKDMFTRILTAGHDLPAARETLRSEIARRIVAKRPFTGDVSMVLLARYDLAIDGPASLQPMIESAIDDVHSLRDQAWKDTAQNAVELAKIYTAAVDAKPARDWLAIQLDKLEAEAHMYKIDHGKVSATDLYAGLHRLLLGTLRRQGAEGAALARAAEKAMADKLAAVPTTQPTTKPK